MTQSAMPRLRSGLRLQRCDKGKAYTPRQNVQPARQSNSLRHPASGYSLVVSIQAQTHPIETSYTGVGGHFDAAGSGPADKKFPSHIVQTCHSSSIQAGWATPVNVQMQIKRLSDGQIVATKNWTSRRSPISHKYQQWDPESSSRLSWRGAHICVCAEPEVGPMVNLARTRPNHSGEIRGSDLQYLA